MTTKKTTMQEEIRKIIMEGLPKGNVTAVINDILILITKIRLEELKADRKKIDKTSGFYNYHVCVYLDSKINELKNEKNTIK